MRVNFNTCEDATIRIKPVQTEEIPLPFYHSLSPKKFKDDECPTYEDVLQKSSNYTPYELACFRSKMNTFLAKYSRYCDVVPKRDTIQERNVTRLYLEIFDESGFIPITTSYLKFITPIVDKLLTFLPEFLVVLDFNKNITLESETIKDYDYKVINCNWAIPILPYIKFPRNIITESGRAIDFEVFYQDGILYASFPSNSDYRHLTVLLSRWVKKTLIFLYEKGCILLDSRDDSVIIENWYLEPWSYQYPDLVIENASITLYRPTWSNIYIAPNITPFLRSIEPDSSVVMEICKSTIVEVSSYVEAEIRVEEHFLSK